MVIVGASHRADQQHCLDFGTCARRRERVKGRVVLGDEIDQACRCATASRVTKDTDPFQINLADEERPAGIVVASRNEAAIAEAVLALRNDPEKAALMGRNGRKLAVDRFNVKESAQRHLEIYREVVGNL